MLFFFAARILYVLLKQRFYMYFLEVANTPKKQNPLFLANFKQKKCRFGKQSPN